MARGVLLPMIRILLLTACLLYTALNAPEVLAQVPSNTVYFWYDGSGQRVAKVENGGEHIYYLRNLLLKFLLLHSLFGILLK
ncbi:MAG: hypothetical protein UU74_C0019G0025, partial [Candidatus Woesebacteria bacterium GW2011_GWA1_41_7]